MIQNRYGLTISTMAIIVFPMNFVGRTSRTTPTIEPVIRSPSHMITENMSGPHSVDTNNKSIRMIIAPRKTRFMSGNWTSPIGLLSLNNVSRIAMAGTANILVPKRLVVASV